MAIKLNIAQTIAREAELQDDLHRLAYINVWDLRHQLVIIVRAVTGLTSLLRGGGRGGIDWVGGVGTSDGCGGGGGDWHLVHDIRFIRDKIGDESGIDVRADQRGNAVIRGVGAGGTIVVMTRLLRLGRTVIITLITIVNLNFMLIR
jgi:hypothetical protein